MKKYEIWVLKGEILNRVSAPKAKMLAMICTSYWEVIESIAEINTNLV